MASDSALSAIRAYVGEELRRPPIPQVQAAAVALRQDAGPSVAAILFYGSSLREGSVEGKVIDFYLLVDGYRDYYGGAWPALWNEVLPPNVFFFETEDEGRRLRAKYAVLSLADLAKGAGPSAFQSTLWGRFAQPCALVYCRDESSAEAVTKAISQAVQRLVHETLPLMPARFSAEELWKRGLRESYRCEFRAERRDRSSALYEGFHERYDRLASIALESFGCEEGPPFHFHHRPNPWARSRAAWRWFIRRPLGRLWQAARLIKAAFTVVDGLDYILWKVHAHSGVKIEPTAWQRRHPLLSSPYLAYCLYRRGGFR